MREAYLRQPVEAVARLLGAMDRNPMSPTYGCLDRQYWHYRTSCFPSEMYQEGILPLAYAYTVKTPGNRWHGEARLRELAIAGIRFAACRGRADGSCDDYYPFERALGAAVFSLQACTRAYRVLEIDDPELEAFFRRRADWLMKHGESGRLTNHHALAALGLARTYEIAAQPRYKTAAQAAVRRVLAWQHDEGWFEEYGGADPGYQTVTIDCLAKLQTMWDMPELAEPLRRAVAFARRFLHPDGTFGGEYGSRGTCHFYPHGFELLAGKNSDAAELADGFLRTLATGSAADFSDDRLFAHRLGNLFEAYLDWAPSRPPRDETGETRDAHYPAAGLVVAGTEQDRTLISTARGGVFRRFSGERLAVADAGLILETSSGRFAVSQLHIPPRPSDESERVRRSEVRFADERIDSVTIAGRLHWTRFETATPLKQAVLHLGMISVGRFCRTLVRRLLQRRLIVARRGAPVRHARSFTFRRPCLMGGGSQSEPGLVVTDVIELLDPRIRVRRLAFGSDFQSTYTAASGVFQPASLTDWHDLGDHVDTLNEKRRIEIVRKFY